MVMGLGGMWIKGDFTMVKKCMNSLHQ